LNAEREKSQIVASVSLYIENVLMIQVKNWMVVLWRVKQCALQIEQSCPYGTVWYDQTPFGFGIMSHVSEYISEFC